MSKFEPPPTYTDPMLLNPKKTPGSPGYSKFSPAWLKWFLDIQGYISSSQGASGVGTSTIQHEVLQGLQGGSSGEHYHITAAQNTLVSQITPVGTVDYVLTSLDGVNAGWKDPTLIPGLAGPSGSVGPPGLDADDSSELLIISGPVGPTGPQGPPGVGGGSTSIMLSVDGEDGQDGWSIPGVPGSSAPGSGSTITTIEVNLSSTPVSNGYFAITGSGFTVGKPVIITQAPGPYTGKGTYADEIEMDQINITGYILNATTINCNWGCWTKVFGNIKFNYMVGA